MRYRFSVELDFIAPVELDDAADVLDSAVHKGLARLGHGPSSVIVKIDKLRLRNALEKKDA